MPSRAGPRKGRASSTEERQVLDAFAADWNRRDEFRRRMSDLITTTLENAGVDVVQIESRTKTVESLAEKLRRKEAYVDPLKDVTDLGRARVMAEAYEHSELQGRRAKKPASPGEEPDETGDQTTSGDGGS